jgi:hypothetical protein
MEHPIAETAQRERRQAIEEWIFDVITASTPEEASRASYEHRARANRDALRRHYVAADFV